ncbi:hypothetical protein [Leptothoe spongobia]|uniref:Uncharacterized protein n=1 Tax=Leptothoe spongobia TAU-MAC 1115 TaxID=1967444 RepID=A0A947DDI4_9CYAN|nr:hypothetical protein [Leptothoe spongobia]MBT9314895.1 hypothetical protein [Leptothoe spongobia TAU-MAC 1115]
MSDVPDANADQPPESDLETLKNKMNLELEAISVNQLHNLATQAVEKKLITAHGYRGGQYELLRDGEFVLLSPTEAIQYLQDLLNTED